jgi:IMP dehydrogenase
MRLFYGNYAVNANMIQSFSVAHDFPLALSYDDVLLVPQYSKINSRSDVDLSTSLSPKLKLKIPLVSTKMDKVTGVEMAVAMGKLGGMGILPRFEDEEAEADKVAAVKKSGVVAAAAVGCKEGFLQRAELLVKAGASVLNIDVAHGHMAKSLAATTKLRQRFGDKVTIISGITATYECAIDLYKAGADCLLVGIGAGSICTTRVQTGCGLPGLASLLETARAAKRLKKTFMPDAGIRNSGDIVKALATGASAICAGFLFSGTDEAPGEIIKIGNKLFKKYNGSASPAEKKSHVETDPSDKNEHYVVHIEGVEGIVPYKGPVEIIVRDLLAGVRSGLAYVGAKNIPELWKKAKFVQITGNGGKESGSHDVITT